MVNRVLRVDSNRRGSPLPLRVAAERAYTRFMARFGKRGKQTGATTTRRSARASKKATSAADGRFVAPKAPRVGMPDVGSGLPQVGVPSGVVFVPGASASGSVAFRGTLRMEVAHPPEQTSRPPGEETL